MSGVVEPGHFSREALMARLGPEAFAEAEREGLEAPPPTPEVVALVRRVFRPTLLKMHAELSRMT